MSWSKRYMQKKISTHTGGDVLTEPTKPGFVSFGSTGSPDPVGKKSGEVLFTNYGAGYRHPDGRVESGTPEPTPPPAVDWPADMNNMLRRVSAFYEWTQADRADFTAWARRSPDGMADARAFLEAEAAKLGQ